MAFHNFIIRLTSEVRPLLGDAPTVMELGNQTFFAKGDILVLLRDFLTSNGIGYDAAALDSLDVRYRKGDLDRLTEAYYSAIGFSSYGAIDVNSLYGSLVMDLNTDICEQYGFNRQFDLVTNNGTGEHVFDQGAVLKNMHQMTAVGGIMIHCLPCNNYVNHGFYSFSPLLVLDLAEVNGYEVLKLSVGSGFGVESAYVSGNLAARYDLTGLSLLPGDFLTPVSDRSLPRYLLANFASALGIKRGKRPAKLERAIRRSASGKRMTMVAAVLRKRVDSEFRRPIQGRYGGENLEEESLQDSYRVA
jgi:hypothetical protein